MRKLWALIGVSVEFSCVVREPMACGLAVANDGRISIYEDTIVVVL